MPSAKAAFRKASNSGTTSDTAVSQGEQRRRQDLRRALTMDTVKDAAKFAEFDQDGNKKLDFDEFYLMQPENVRGKFSRSDIRTWFDAADDNGDGELSIDEFFKWSLNNASLKYGSTALKTTFEKYDRDGSGYLNAWEFEQAATEMGFGAVANTLFKSLDHDGSGSVTYGELLETLKKGAAVDVETKALLSSMLWTYDGSTKAESNRTLKTNFGTIKGTDVQTVLNELRDVLNKSGGDTIDLIKLFDDDATPELLIDDMEFQKAMRTRFGYKGTTAVLEKVFRAIDTDRRGALGFDELYEFTRGKKHSLDRRFKRVADMKLLPPPGVTLDSIVWSMDTLQLLLQAMLVRCNIGPTDVIRAWDVDGNRTLSKDEFLAHLERFFDDENPDLWKNEIYPIAKDTYTEVANLGTGLYGKDPRKQINVVNFERWLNAPCKITEVARKTRKMMRQMTSRRIGDVGIQKAPPRVDTVAQRKAEIAAAAQRAAIAKGRWYAEEQRQLVCWIKSRNTVKPLQRWEMPRALIQAPITFGSPSISMESLSHWKTDTTKLFSSPHPLPPPLPWARGLRRSHSRLVSPGASPQGGMRRLSTATSFNAGGHRLTPLEHSQSTPSMTSQQVEHATRLSTAGGDVRSNELDALDPLIDALEAKGMLPNPAVPRSGQERKKPAAVYLKPAIPTDSSASTPGEEEARPHTPLWEAERQQLGTREQSSRGLLQPPRMRAQGKLRNSQGRPQTPLWMLF